LDSARLIWVTQYLSRLLTSSTASLPPVHLLNVCAAVASAREHREGLHRPMANNLVIVARS